MSGLQAIEMAAVNARCIEGQRDHTHRRQQRSRRPLTRWACWHQRPRIPPPPRLRTHHPYVCHKHVTTRSRTHTHTHTHTHAHTHTRTHAHTHTRTHAHTHTCTHTPCGPRRRGDCSALNRAVALLEGVNYGHSSEVSHPQQQRVGSCGPTLPDMRCITDHSDVVP
jgi:hypothetical protein